VPYEINWEMDGVLVQFWETFDFQESNNATIEILDAPQFGSLK